MSAHFAPGALTFPSNPEVGPALRRLTSADRVHAEETLARTPEDAPLHDYLVTLLDNEPRVSHVDYVLGLEAELARLRELAGGAR